ncbi:uncharacterized protein SCHCODRAFT_02613385 [Schizophyllum commune H4-8]|nr:uncharacterized protein SCHCODRAFT_02613385 [Schizophyllum commune H4-8]KAI5898866.1 hypothetical protein SCHCODRAFT_02613385 [Schizophyllum commune H4-8]
MSATFTTHDSDDEFWYYSEIETIVHPRVKADNSGWEYLIKFVGFGDEEKSYVDDTEMSGARLLLDSFWTDIGFYNKDYQPGEILEPSKEWQERQLEEVRRRKEAE